MFNHVTIYLMFNHVTIYSLFNHVTIYWMLMQSHAIRISNEKVTLTVSISNTESIELNWNEIWCYQNDEALNAMSKMIFFVSSDSLDSSWLIFSFTFAFTLAFWSFSLLFFIVLLFHFVSFVLSECFFLMRISSWWIHIQTW